jgi:hypothetical protein
VYVGGYDLSGYTRSFGPLGVTYEEATDDPINATVKGTWAGQATVNFGTLNALFDNTATVGAHARLATAGASHSIMATLGMETAEAVGNPVFCGQFIQKDYIATPSDSPVTLTIPYSASGTSATLLYASPWGELLHANSAVIAVNSATGQDFGATDTAFGGWMMYQVTTSAGAGDITATIKVQDSDTNVSGDFDDLLSSGVINTGSGGVAVPTPGVVALAPTATVRRYTRWQIVLGTATSVTFLLAFMRNRHN